MDVQDTVLIDFAERVARRESPPITGTRTSGRYASRVEISSPHGSTFDGLRGIVVKVVSDTLFVRLHQGGRDVVLPFGTSEVTVLP